VRGGLRDVDVRNTRQGQKFQAETAGGAAVFRDFGRSFEGVHSRTGDRRGLIHSQKSPVFIHILLFDE
jgi:hypothetical protein